MVLFSPISPALTDLVFYRVKKFMLQFYLKPSPVPKPVALVMVLLVEFVVVLFPTFRSS